MWMSEDFKELGYNPGYFEETNTECEVRFFYDDGGEERGFYKSFTRAIEAIFATNQYVKIRAASIVVDNITVSRLAFSQHQPVNLDSVQSISFPNFRNELICDNNEEVNLMFEALDENCPVEILGSKWDVVAIIHNLIIPTYADSHVCDVLQGVRRTKNQNELIFLIQKHQSQERE